MRAGFKLCVVAVRCFVASKLIVSSALLYAIHQVHQITADFSIIFITHFNIAQIDKFQ
jgi:hypothetical protein